MSTVPHYPWRTMISSTMIDLPREREAARQVIEQAGLTPWYAEEPPREFEVSGYELSVEMARRCDLYLLIVGSRYGSRPEGMPPGDTRSVTHLEFDTAREHNPRKIRVFVPMDAAAIAETPQQLAFLAQVTDFARGPHYYVYDRADLASLQAEIRHAIGQWLDHAGRDEYVNSVAEQYATFRNPITGAEMPFDATVLLKLRTELEGTSAHSDWEKQVAEEDGDRRKRVRGRDRKREVAEDRQRERIREAAKPLVAQVGEFLQQFGRLALLGDVGSGKSTLLRRLAHDTARAYLQMTIVTAPTVPILVRASDLGRTSTLHPELTLPEVLGLLKEEETPAEGLKPTIRATVAEAVYRGDALLLVDGLDEARAEEQQRTLTILGQIGSNRAILASRPSAYRSQLPTWRNCELQRLDQTQRRQLIAQVFRTVLGEDELLPDPEPLERELDSRNDLFAWAGNPLLLTLIATQYVRARRLSESRARIYQFAIEDMQRQRPLTARRYFTEEELDRLRRELALRMTEAGVRLTTLAEARDRFLGSLLRDIAPDIAPALRDACAFEVLDRSGVLQQVDAERWEFVHLSFREYLAACALAEMNPRARWQLLRTRALSAQWEEVFFLLVSRLDSERHESQANAVLRALIALDRARVPVLGGTDPTHTALRLATRCYFSRPARTRDPRLRAALMAGWRPLWRSVLGRTITESTLGEVSSSVASPKWILLDSFSYPNCLLLGTLVLPATGHWIRQHLSRNGLSFTLELIAATFVLAFVAGQLALHIPVVTRSGIGLRLISSLPLFNLGLLLLFAGCRVLLHRWQFEDYTEAALEATLSSDTLVSGVSETIATQALMDMLLVRVKNSWGDISSFPANPAGSALGALGARAASNKKVMAQLLALLHDGYDSQRRTALLAIERLGEAVASNEGVIAELLALLTNWDHDVRRRAVETLGALGPAIANDNTVIAGLLACLKDLDQDVREEGVRAFGKLGLAVASNKAVVEGLLTVLTSHSTFHEEEMYQAVMQSLGVPSPAGAANDVLITALLALLNDPDTDVRRKGVRVLRALGPAVAGNKAVIARLVACLKDPDKYVRAAAISTLATYGASGPTGAGTDAIVTWLLACLEDGDGWVRQQAAEALGPLIPVITGSEIIVMGLRACLKDPDEEVRIAAARTLGPQVEGTDAVVTDLLTRLEDGNIDMWARRKAVGGLKTLGPEVAGTGRVIEQLLACLEDEDEFVRGDAAAALGSLAASGPGVEADEVVITGLLACLEDEDEFVRQQAVKGLGALGPRLRGNYTVAIALVAHLGDVSDVRNQVRNLLVTKGPGSIGTEALVTAFQDKLGDSNWFRETWVSWDDELLGMLGVSEGAVMTLLAYLKSQDQDIRERAVRALQSLALSVDSIPTSARPARCVRNAALRPRWWWAPRPLKLVQRLCDWPVVVCAMAAQVLVIWPALTQAIRLPTPIHTILGLAAWWQILLLAVGYLALNGGLAYVSLVLASSQAGQRNALLYLLEHLLSQIDDSGKRRQ